MLLTWLVSLACVAATWRLISRALTYFTRCAPFPVASVTPVDRSRRGLKLADVPRAVDAVVIGSGPSGLATAILLGRQGKRVLVLEQHDRAGGGLHSWTEDGFEFDTGFHYSGELAEGKELRRIVDSLTNGKVEWAHLQDCPVDPGVYDEVRVLSRPGDDPYVVRAGRAAWIEGLKKRFPAAEDVAAIDRYVADCDTTGARFLVHAIWRSLPWYLRWGLRRVMATPMARIAGMAAGDRLNAITDNKQLQLCLGYLSLGCCGVCPDDISYGVVTGLHNHFSGGASYPVGGPGRIAEEMVKQIEDQHGGRVFVRAAVQDITVDGSGRVTGVHITKGARSAIHVRSSIVVSTAGLFPTFQQLLPQPQYGRALSRQLNTVTRTNGHIFLFLGIRGSTEELALPRKNTWVLPDDDLGGAMAGFQADRTQPFGYVGVAFPSAKDPSYGKRHPGTSTCAVIAGDVPYSWFEEWSDTRVHHRGASYDQLKLEFQERLLEIVYSLAPQVRGRVTYINVGTPLDTNFYLGKTRGESYGLRLTPSKAKAEADWLLPTIPGAPSGLYVAGQDTSSDGFAPAVMSALITTAAIEGPLHWLALVPMLGGIRNVLKMITNPGDV